jgi:hypothetical protein
VIVAYTEVDDEDFALLSQYSWHLNEGYPSRSIRLEVNGMIVKRQERMHRFLLGLPRGRGPEVDHIDRDKLNNRRNNLRTGTHAQNLENHPGFGGTSRHRGVWRHSGGRWTASYGGKPIGLYDSEEEAAMAISNWRRQHLTFSVEGGD